MKKIESSEIQKTRIGRRWTLEEENQLLDEIKQGVSRTDIANAHGRTESGIFSRLSTIAARLAQNENKSIEEIENITGLKDTDIHEAIRRYKHLKPPPTKEEALKKTLKNKNIDLEKIQKTVFEKCGKSLSTEELLSVAQAKKSKTKKQSFEISTLEEKVDILQKKFENLMKEHEKMNLKLDKLIFLLDQHSIFAKRE